LPEEQPIVARLAGAGSVRQELQALLAAAPRGASRTEYRRLVVEENVAGKGSAVTRAKIWQRLKDRYVLDQGVPEFRAFAAGMADTTDAREQGMLCLLMMARTDRLFREVTLECVSPALQREGTTIEPSAIQEGVESRVNAGGRRWSADTLQHVRQHILSSLKDFGALTGSAAKRTAKPRPGVAATLFAVRLARLQGVTDRRVPASDWFRLFGQSEEGAIALLYEAARHGALGFRAQAGVVELSLRETNEPVAAT
jgi:hypothetical protein